MKGTRVRIRLGLFVVAILIGAAVTGVAQLNRQGKPMEGNAYQDGLTPDTPTNRRLMAALQKGDLSEVKAAVEAGGDLDARMGPEHSYPIALLAAAGEPGQEGARIPLLRYVAEHVKDPGIHDRGMGASLLMFAADVDDLETVQILVRRGADINYRTPARGGMGGVNALWSAILYGGGHNLRLSKVAKFLIEHGADVNGADARGMTPLMSATLYGKAEVMEALLAHGADPSAKAPDGRTALDFARRSRHPEVGSLLASRTKLDLIGAARFGRVEDLRKMLDGGSDPNLTNARKETPLGSAILADNPEAARLLLERGAKVDIPERAGRLPIHLAAAVGSGQIIELLAKHGADPNARLASGEPRLEMDTPLQVAIGYSQPQAVEELLKHGAKVSDAGRSRTPLTFAIAHAGMPPRSPIEGSRRRMPEEFLADSDRIIQLLLAHGADPKENHSEAVYAAAEHGQVGLLKLLLDRGGSPNATGIGMSPWKDQARRPALSASIWALSDPRWQQEAMKEGTLSGPDAADLKRSERVANAAFALLLQRGADVNLADDMGETPLMEAIFWDTLDVAKRLIDKGARVDATDAAGETALIKAARDGKTEAVRLLLGHGANVNARSKAGMTPLLACVDRTENDQARASRAELEGHLEHAHGQPPAPLDPKSLPNPDGHPDIVILLLKHGADPKFRDVQKRSVLDLAKAQGFTKVVEALRR